MTESLAQEGKVCPRCAETVQAAAKVCRYCGFEFDGERQSLRQPDQRQLIGAWTSIVGAVVLGLAALLPWATISTGFGSVSRSGVDRGGDGILVLLIAAAIAGTGIHRLISSHASDLPAFASIGLGLAGATLGVYDFGEVQQRVDDVSNEFITGTVGIGLYLVFVGSAIAVAGGWLRERHQSQSEPRMDS